MDHLREERAGDWRKEKRRAQKLALRGPSVKAIDVSFFRDISILGNTMKNLLAREGDGRFPDSFISADIAVMLNQMRVTFDLLAFVNADEPRDDDPHYRLGYSFVVLPLVRTLIDGFYNITVLLDDPSKARTFRLSGYKRMLDAIQEDEDLYGHELGWTEYIRQQRDSIDIGLAEDHLSHDDLKGSTDWSLLGRYLKSSPANDSKHKKLMRRFIHGPWRLYSEISHVTFRGATALFQYLNVSDVPHHFRAGIRERAERSLAQHLGRAASVLLSTLTEIQATYKFEGHEVNERLQSIWSSMVNFPDAKDMYDIHYRALMERSGIKQSNKHRED